MNRFYLWSIVLFGLSLTACQSESAPQKPQTPSSTTTRTLADNEAELRQYSRAEYPENPDWKYPQAPAEPRWDFERIRFESVAPDAVDLYLYASATTDSFRLPNISLSAALPRPSWTRDTTWANLSLWSQQQSPRVLSFSPNAWKSHNTQIDSGLVRVDLVRAAGSISNWELIFWSGDSENTYPSAHFWFTCPPQVLAKAFGTSSPIVAPDAPMLSLERLRQALEIQRLPIENHKEEALQWTGAQQYLKHLVKQPQNPSTIAELLTADTWLATQTQAGIFSTQDSQLLNPDLTRLAEIHQAFIRKVALQTTQSDTCVEMQLEFAEAPHFEPLILHIGGWQKSQIPTCALEEHARAYAIPMGFAVPPVRASSPTDTPQTAYAYFTETTQIWINPETLGVAEIRLHFDLEDPDKLHIWCLSTHRLAVVGHFTCKIPSLGTSISLEPVSQPQITPVDG